MDKINVWIVAHVTLLAGSHLGRGCVVGANSLFNKERLTCDLGKTDLKHYMEQFRFAYLSR